MLELLDKPRNSQAWNRFLELGLPSKESEVYRYVRLKELYRHTYRLPTHSTPNFTPQEGTLLFVNGSYCEELSRPPKGVIALPLSKAFITYGTFLKGRIATLLKQERDPFAALNGAYFQEGLFLYIPPKYSCEIPLKVMHLIDEVSEPALLAPRIHLFAGKEASAKLLLSQEIDHSHMWLNTFVDLALEERASFRLTTTSWTEKSSYSLFALRATLKKGSRFESCSSTNGGAVSREDYCVRLIGEGAEAALYGVWALKEHRQHHVNVFMEHQEPHCTSLQKFKGALHDRSYSSFEGKIYVHQKAQKTQAYQMNNNLILGEKAAANSKPNLEIFADDVKASHGATTGQLDEEQLFYLTTRGIPTAVARHLLVQGFTGEILDQIQDIKTRQKAYEKLS